MKFSKAVVKYRIPILVVALILMIKIIRHQLPEVVDADYYEVK